MSLSEKLLFLLSRKAGSDDYQTPGIEWNISDALSTLCRNFPDFKTSISDKYVVDFGCGMGYQAVTMALHGAKYVLGIDISENALRKGQKMALEFGVNQKMRFIRECELSDHFKERFDIIISQNSMEHFDDPFKVLDKMKWLLKQDGKIFITFGPPWFSPYGSHMHFFTKVPWVNILFSEKTVMKVRGNFRKDGAIKYEEVESGLNKMTVKKFERIISDNDLEVVYKKYDCVKGINFLSKIPFIRELFINHISCVVAKRSSV